MVKKFLSKFSQVFTGETAKGMSANYPKVGELRIQSTCMPSEKVDFNSWANNLRQVKTGK